MGLYGELNTLILKNGLRNTTGPAYTELSPLGTKVTPGASVSTKWQSVYPGIGVLLTVEGPYQNLRHFVQDIERSEQFVIINQVELQRAENSSQLAEAEQSSSGSRVSLVSLQLNMSTYFQRQAAGNGQE
jgi:Tfp pilus assembly protein PilO